MSTTSPTYKPQDPNAIVIQSHGMGVESQAILERWHAEPESRPFADWSQLIVISAQVGDEHKVDTIRDCEARMLPILREHKVRFVEVARRGHLEADGIVVLQDTREPQQLHPDGRWTLRDELLLNGTVPQFGGEHRCAMKFKAFVIETWLAWEFRNEQTRPVFHAFGYNPDEDKRIDNSEWHIAENNRKRLVDKLNRPPLEIFGFNNEELGRIERSKEYDGPHRQGLYPLRDWGWSRQQCSDYIKQQSGIDWRKSHCSYCPFCREAAKGEDGAIKRWTEAPEQTAQGLLVEYNALCFNFRSTLYSSGSLFDMVNKRGVGQVMVAFAKLLEECPWGFYRIRRIYKKKGSAIRCLEKLEEGSRVDMTALWQEEKSFLGEANCRVHKEHGIFYLMVHEREPDVYPTQEEFFVVAPGFTKNKVRGPQKRFEERWIRMSQGLPPDPIKEKSTDIQFNLPLQDELQL